MVEFQFPGVKATPWNVLEMKPQTSFSIVMSMYMISDVFLALSAFLGTYKCMQILEANGGKLNLIEVFRLYAVKYLRMAPMIIIVFLFGWGLGARMWESPNWTKYQSLFLNCDKYWWA